MSLVENFDSYNNGDLNGQGDWSGDTDYDIQGTTVKAGAKAAEMNGVGGNIAKGITPEDTGSQVFWARAGQTNKRGKVNLKDDSNGKTMGAIGFGDAGEGGVNKIFVAGASIATLIDGYSADTWYRMEIEWRTSDNKVRGRAGVSDGSPGAWSAWINWGAGSVNVDAIHIYTTNDSGSFFFDEFSDPNIVVAKPRSFGAVI